MRVDVDGISLNYEDTGGEGPVVLLVHGLGGSTEGWRGQLEGAPSALRVLALDQRGAGQSEKPTGPYSVEVWAEDLERFLDALGVARAALAGHSVGCMIAEHAALRLGERCWALALCGGALAWREEALPVFEQRVELAAQGRMEEIAEAVATTAVSGRTRREHPELYERVKRLVASADPRGYAQWAAATALASMSDPTRLACPVLAFCGSEDPVTPPAAAEAIAAAAPAGRSAVVDGVAHWCMLEDPDATNAVLFGFLEERAVDV